MIKLQWYALAKPHVVHRYYRIKERPIAIGAKFWFTDCVLRVYIKDKDNITDRVHYNMACKYIQAYIRGVYPHHTTNESFITSLKEYAEGKNLHIEIT